MRSNQLKLKKDIGSLAHGNQAKENMFDFRCICPSMMFSLLVKWKQRTVRTGDCEKSFQIRNTTYYFIPSNICLPCIVHPSLLIAFN